MQKTFPVLYGISKTDKTKQWQISVKLNPDKTASIETKNGYVDGKMNINALADYKLIRHRIRITNFCCGG